MSQPFFYLLEIITKPSATKSHAKSKIAVRRCITASKPRALERSKSAPVPASKTLSDWFLAGCMKIAKTIITDKIKRMVNKILYIFVHFL